MDHKKSARLERFSESCSACGGFGTITRYYGGGEFVSTIDCDQCGGRGEIGNCARCEGTGIIQEEGNATAPGIECPDCRGAGAIGDCPDCSGTGVVQVENSNGQISKDESECPTCNGFGFLNDEQNKR